MTSSNYTRKNLVTWNQDMVVDISLVRFDQSFAYLMHCFIRSRPSVFRWGGGQVCLHKRKYASSLVRQMDQGNYHQEYRTGHQMKTCAGWKYPVAVPSGFSSDEIWALRKLTDPFLVKTWIRIRGGTLPVSYTYFS